MKLTKAMLALTLLIALIMAAAGVAAMSAPDTNTAEEIDSKHYVNQGDYYYEEGEYLMALACYNSALAINETDIAALHGAAKSNNALEYLDDALECYDKLVGLAPDVAEIRLERVNTLLISGRLDEAKNALEEAMSVFDDEKMEQLYRQMVVESPEVGLKPGTYDSYQLLHMSTDSPNALIYYTTDGSEPNLGSDICVDGVVISAPETLLKVKCINYLGYESETVELSYTVTVPVEEVFKNDESAFALAVRTLMGRSERQAIYNYELAQIRELYIVGKGRYSDIEDATFRNDMYSSSSYLNHFTDRGSCDLDYLRYTPFLETLGVCWQKGVDLEPITELEYLKNLSLLNNGITDISALAEIDSLEKLALGWNKISDVEPLRNMTNLVSLGLWNNNISSIDALSGLNKLQYLDVSYNKLTNVDAAAQLGELKEFWAANNMLTNIDALDPDGVLRILMISGNSLEGYREWRETHPDLVRSDYVE